MNNKIAERIIKRLSKLRSGESITYAELSSDIDFTVGKQDLLFLRRISLRLFRSGKGTRQENVLEYANRVVGQLQSRNHLRLVWDGERVLL